MLPFGGLKWKHKGSNLECPLLSDGWAASVTGVDNVSGATGQTRRLPLFRTRIGGESSVLAYTTRSVPKICVHVGRQVVGRDALVGGSLCGCAQGGGSGPADRDSGPVSLYPYSPAQKTRIPWKERPPPDQEPQPLEKGMSKYENCVSWRSRGVALA